MDLVDDVEGVCSSSIDVGCNGWGHCSVVGVVKYQIRSRLRCEIRLRPLECDDVVSTALVDQLPVI